MVTLTAKYDVGDKIYILTFSREKECNTNNATFFDNNFAKIFHVQIVNVFVSTNSEPVYEVADEDNEKAVWNEPFEESLCFESLAEATTALLNKWFPNNDVNHTT